jgi:cytidyltransferase-like protein
VIVATEQLPSLSRKVAMVDGGFDPIHAGHVAYFRAGAELGVPVLCNVSGDVYVSRKHPPFLPESERIQVIDAIRYIDYVHLSRTSTATVLRALLPRYYVKGADWRGRLPADEVELCEAEGVEIVYLDTVTNSSSRIVEDFMNRMGSNAN